MIQHPGPSPLYHVCDDIPMSFTEAMDAAAAIAGARRPLRAPAFLLRWMAPVGAGMTAKYLAMSHARLEEDLGWRPRFPGVLDGAAALVRGDRRAA
ncbi:MAG TPA: hypothetical protein VNK92_08250 [Vicinamibacterales bacterium]|nr:hypothetical protein [Vicinamibacterales bacterium]